jgi:glyoxylase-like metal-dependent hydrolase (beta-lactamase superfamily II)
MRAAVSIISSVSLAALAAMAAAGGAQAQAPNFDEVQITTHQLADGLYYLEGQGGNIAVSVGDDGVLIVDDQFAPLSQKILDAIAALSDHPVRFVINTHHHGDHTGGNANMAATGATIVAHENARNRIRGNFEAPAQGDPQPVPAGALPVITFSDDVTFHFNGEEIRVHHVAPAHTDGDSFVLFVNANVIHTGDVFRTTSYPAADVPGGGSFQGILDAYQVLLDMAGPETKLLPGHGVVSTESAVTEQLAMIQTIRGTVEAFKGEGQSLEQVISLKPSAAYDAQWSSGRWTGDYVVTELYNAAP